MQWTAQIFCWNERSVSGVLCKNIFVADLSESQYLLETFQTSFAVKNSENIVNSGCFEKCSGWRALIFFSEMKEGYKVSCVKILIFR